MIMNMLMIMKIVGLTWAGAVEKSKPSDVRLALVGLAEVRLGWFEQCGDSNGQQYPCSDLMHEVYINR